MGMNWQANDYFSVLMFRDKRAHAALEMLVDDLHVNKERTISRFLSHSGSEDFLWGVVRLLGNSNSRVAGNAAYILGTVAESEAGSMRVISLTASRHNEGKRILLDLTTMLTFDDAESVMNAAGTMGTLAESHDGRNWMLKEPCLKDTIQHITALLDNDNMWTASNAALVLARLTIAEEGCEQILRHTYSDSILAHLVASLGVDEAGRGMNAAFAIGRLCDMEEGRSRLLGLSDSEKMISSLAKMLCCNDAGASKNACFALSCLATNNEGHRRLLKNGHSGEVLKTLCELLSAEDCETGWFAAMTLRTLAGQPKGCLRLRDHPSVMPALKAVEIRDGVNSDLREEVIQTLEILKRLQKPSPPEVHVLSGSEVRVEWAPQTTKSGFKVKYRLYEGTRCLFDGPDLHVTLNDLQPATQYSYRVRAYQEGDESAFSEATTISTEETVPTGPQNVRILGVTTTQLKIGWEPPEITNGALKGYYVFNGEKQVEHTAELSTIITGLQPSTVYEISVCAATVKGKGPRETVTGTTSELGAHAPSKPDVTVRGRSEMHVTWKPPEVPLGRISRYDVCMNGEVVYSGMDLHHVVRRLKPDTEYAFTVSAITTEGKCESKPTKKRTLKDEYEGDRAPLYQTPVKKEPELEKKEETAPKPSPKKRKSVPNTDIGVVGPGRGSSARSIKRHSKSAGPRFKFSYSHADPNKARSREAKSSETEPSSDKNHNAPEGPDGSTSTPSVVSDPPEQKTYLPISSAQAWEFSSFGNFPEEIKHIINAQSAKPSPSRKKPVDTEREKPRPVSNKNKPLPKPRTIPSPARRPGKIPDLTNTVDNSSEKRSTKRLPKSKTRLSSDNVSLSSRTKSGTTLLSHIDNVNRVISDTATRSEVSVAATDISSTHDRGKLLGRRGSVRSTLSSESEFVDEPDVSWLSQVRRTDYSLPSENVTRTFSTIYGGGTYRTAATKPLRAGFMELEVELPGNGLSQGGPPSYVHRANTFIASHSSSRKNPPNKPGMKKQLEKIASPSVSNSTPNQWKPELPSTVTEKNHNKFVPMQFRTQPANLPRQNTSTNLTEKVPHLEPIAIMTRSKTDMVALRAPHTQANDPHPVNSKLSSSSTHLRNAVGTTLSRGASPSHQPTPRAPPSNDTSLMPGIVLNVPDQNTLQSAR